MKMDVDLDPAAESSEDGVEDVFLAALDGRFPPLESSSADELLTLALSHVHSLEGIVDQEDSKDMLLLFKALLHLEDLHGKIWACQHWHSRGFTLQSLRYIVIAIVATFRYIAALRLFVSPSVDSKTPLARQISLREDFTCITGKRFGGRAIQEVYGTEPRGVTGLLEKPSKEAYEKIDQLNDEGLELKICEGVYLFPLSMALHSEGLKIIRFLQALTGVNVREFEDSAGEIPENAIFLGSTLASEYNRFEFALRPTETPNKYDIVWSSERVSLLYAKAKSLGEIKSITFNPDSKIPIPSPSILSLHYHLFSLLHSSPSSSLLLHKFFRPHHLAETISKSAFTELGDLNGDDYYRLVWVDDALGRVGVKGAEKRVRKGQWFEESGEKEVKIDLSGFDEDEDE